MSMSAETLLPAAPLGCTVNTLDGGRMLVRGAMRLGAVALGAAAVGLWAAPGALWQADVMLLKLFLSLFALLGAAGLWSAGARPSFPVVEIDLARATIQLTRVGVPAAQRVIERCAFADLGHAEQAGGLIAFWTRDGRLLAEITLGDAADHGALVAALRAAGKLD